VKNPKLGTALKAGEFRAGYVLLRADTSIPNSFSIFLLIEME